MPDVEIHNEHGRIVLALNGRSNEYVLLPNGTKVGAAAISLIINDFPEIMSSQIIQKKINFIEENILVEKKFEIDEKKLLYKLRERLGNDIEIIVNTGKE